MLETLKKEWSAKVGLLLFLIFGIWWLTLQFPPHQTNLSNQLFGSLYFIVAAWGMAFGFYISRKWGGTKSLLGKALTMFSLGLLGQVLGQCIYTYYYYGQHITVPYPSWGDLGYFGSIPCYILGILFLAKASGTTLKLKSKNYKLIAILIPFILLTISYIIFLKGYTFNWTNPIKIFLDFGYPLGEAMYISLAVLTFLLSHGVLGGMMKPLIIYILFSMSVQFLADYSFLYLSSNNLWYSGGINDIFYITSYFLMASSLIQFDTLYKKLKEKK